MEITRIRIVTILAALIILLALGLRLYRLGAAPLSDFEAERALQALQVSQGERGVLGAGPAYPMLTGLLFAVFEDSNFVARLLPALVGTLLVFTPFLFIPQLGLIPAFIIAFGLAVDPGLVAISRLAGGSMLALSFGLLSLACIFRQKLILAGLFGGLFLLSGPAAIQGAVTLGITYLLGKALFKGQDWGSEHFQTGIIQKTARESALLVTSGMILAAGTLFLVQPQGFSSITASLPAYLNGWVQPSGIPALQLLGALIFYNPLIVIFGLVASISGWRRNDLRLKWFGLWAIIALLFSLIFPGRQAGDLVWAIIPLWGLTGIEIARLLSIDDKDRLPVLGQAALILILLALAWLNLAGLDQSAGDPNLSRLRWGVIAGTILLGLVTTVLVSLGWSRKVSQSGLAWGLVVGLGMFGLASLWNVSQVHPNGEQELWYPRPASGQVHLFLETLGDLSHWRTGMRETIDIAVLTPEPSVRWALRNYPAARFLSGTVVGELPSIIINAEGQAEPSLSAGYRGQDFSWWIYPAWQGVLPPDWASWLVFRDSPQQPVHLILWARADLFPGGVLGLGDDLPLVPEQDIPPNSPTQ